MAMDGRAAKVIADIDVELLPDLDMALEMYEERFATKADSQLARSEFLTAKQMDDESILEWHARLRELFLRAYPGSHVDCTGLGDQLRELFIRGLNDPDISAFVWDREPKTYNRTLAYAETKRAITMKLQDRDPTRQLPGLHSLTEMPSTEEEGASSTSSTPLLAAFQPRRNRDKDGDRDGSCHICHQQGHRKKDCPSWNHVLRYFRRVGLPANNGGSGGVTGKGEVRGDRTTEMAHVMQMAVNEEEDEAGDALIQQLLSPPEASEPPAEN